MLTEKKKINKPANTEELRLGAMKGWTVPVTLRDAQSQEKVCKWTCILQTLASKFDWDPWCISKHKIQTTVGAWYSEVASPSEGRCVHSVCGSPKGENVQKEGFSKFSVLMCGAD